MPGFKGFPATGNETIPVPEVFFTELLPEVDDLGELRITLYAFWNLSGQVKEPRYLRFAEIVKDTVLMSAYGKTVEAQKTNLAEALERACRRGTLLNARSGGEDYYFLNSDQGRAAMEGLQAVRWNPEEEQPLPLRLQTERPNIFTLYEQNIGPLTPILSDTLQDAEKTYSAEWIEEAIRIAVTRNVRNWQYVDAILRSWKEKGKDGADRKTAEKNRKRDSEGKYADFVNH